MNQYMKKAVSVLTGTSIIGTGLVLSGCQESQSDIERALSSAESTATIQQNSLNEINKDQAEAKKALVALQKDDPNVKDAFYSVNEDGEKVLNVVKTDSVGNAFVYALTGFMIANALNGVLNSSYSNQKSMPATKLSSYKKEEKSRYTGAVTTAATTSYLKSKGISSARASAFTSRSSSTSTARAGAYSSGS